MSPKPLDSKDGLCLDANTYTADSIHVTKSKSEGSILSRKQCLKTPSSPTNSITLTSPNNRSNSGTKENELRIVWGMVAFFIIIHGISFYGLYILLTFRIKFATFIFHIIYEVFTVLGVTAGAHRLWSHRSYKAKLPLRIFLMLGQTASMQFDLHVWARDHRVHHKFTDTDADPHNSRRGIFFSHIGWLMCRKHTDVLAKRKTIDISDLLVDPVIKFQKKYYLPLVFIIALAVPYLISWYVCGEDGLIAFVFMVTRIVIGMHLAFGINSVAHMWGMRPYDKTINPRDSHFLSIITLGEGWHNYHHVFPWDYNAAELGYYKYNFTKCFLDFMGKIGWATDFKTVSEERIKKRKRRTGDGSWPNLEKLENNKSYDVHDHHQDGKLLWGWGDRDMDNEEIKRINRINA